MRLGLLNKAVKQPKADRQTAGHPTDTYIELPGHFYRPHSTYVNYLHPAQLDRWHSPQLGEPEPLEPLLLEKKDDINRSTSLLLQVGQVTSGLSIPQSSSNLVPHLRQLNSYIGMTNNSNAAGTSLIWRRNVRLGLAMASSGPRT